MIGPDEGTVEPLGRKLEHLGGDAFDAVGGFVEEPSFYPYLSGRSNLRLMTKLDGWHGEAARSMTRWDGSASPIGARTA